MSILGFVFRPLSHFFVTEKNENEMSMRGAEEKKGYATCKLTTQTERPTERPSVITSEQGAIPPSVITPLRSLRNWGGPGYREPRKPVSADRSCLL